MKKPVTVDEYIASFPKETQVILHHFRSIVLKTAPEAEESISYGMPYYSLGGRLLYFAGYKNHLGFYPMPAAILAFKEKLSNYQCSKGTVQFPLDKALPQKLIKDMINFRIEENKAKIKSKKK